MLVISVIVVSIIVIFFLNKPSISCQRYNRYEKQLETYGWGFVYTFFGSFCTQFLNRCPMPNMAFRGISYQQFHPMPYSLFLYLSVTLRQTLLSK
jgi:hypothetical protein